MNVEFNAFRDEFEVTCNIDREHGCTPSRGVVSRMCVLLAMGDLLGDRLKRGGERFAFGSECATKKILDTFRIVMSILVAGRLGRYERLLWLRHSRALVSKITHGLTRKLQKTIKVRESVCNG